MSLKVFHIIFISCSLILTLGFGFWSLSMADQLPQKRLFLLGALSLACAVGLLVYGISIVKKFRHIH